MNFKYFLMFAAVLFMAANSFAYKATCQEAFKDSTEGVSRCIVQRIVNKDSSEWVYKVKAWGAGRFIKEDHLIEEGKSVMVWHYEYEDVTGLLHKYKVTGWLTDRSGKTSSVNPNMSTPANFQKYFTEFSNQDMHYLFPDGSPWSLEGKRYHFK